MKFIYLTDVHIKGVNPGKRTDVYYIAILKKLMELKGVILRDKIDFVVIGGDLFDIPKVAPKLYGRVAKILRSWGVKVFVVPGNHDLYGQNIETIDDTSLGNLADSGVVTILRRSNSPLYFQKKSEPNCPLVAITGQEYHNDIDKGIQDDYEIEPSDHKVDYNILAIHSMLVDKPFHPDVPHTVMKDVQTSADVVLAGHYHPDSIDVVYNNTRFIRPTSTARLEATQYNIDNKPNYSIIEITDKGITNTFHEYTLASDGKDVFDMQSGVEQKQHKNALDSFAKTVKDIDVHDANSINEILNKIATSLNSSATNISSCMTRIAAAQQNDTDKTLNGYVPKNQGVQLVKATLHNFQSHSHTVVDFMLNALNGLIGQSDNGKTAVLRAIKWCLYNDPKGDDFIRLGETDCWVELEFSNGYKVRRGRTTSSAGYYEVYDASLQQTQKFTGFSHAVPMDVYNAHQMPKVAIGKEQVSFNLAEQLDGAFMLSQSAGDRATLIGKITGVQHVDASIKEIGKDISNKQKENKNTEREIERLSNEMEQYKHLPAMEKDIQMLELVLSAIESAEQEIADIDSLQQEINNFNTNLAIENQRYQSFTNLNSTKELLDKIELAYQEYLSIEQIESEYLNNAFEECEVKSKINTYAHLDTLKILVDNIPIANTEYNDLCNIETELNLVESSIGFENDKLNSLCKLTEEMLTNLDNMNKEFQDYAKLEEEYIIIDNSIKGISSDIIAYGQNLQSYNAEYKELLNSVPGGVCPICSGHIDSEKIDSLSL